MKLTFCFNQGLIRNLGPYKFDLLIDNEVVHHFTLPNNERTSVHNRNNGLYDLEGKIESPTPPDTPQAYENLPAPLSDVASLASVVHDVPPVTYTSAIDALRTEVVSLRGEFTTLRVDFHGFMDVTNEQFDHIFQEIHSIRRHF